MGFPSGPASHVLHLAVVFVRLVLAAWAPCEC